jgi:hypothetical protein
VAATIAALTATVIARRIWLVAAGVAHPWTHPHRVASWSVDRLTLAIAEASRIGCQSYDA